MQRARRPAPASRPLGFATAVMVDHARALATFHIDSLARSGTRSARIEHDGGEQLAMRTFRKHASWYLTGYPVGGEVRRRFSNVSTLAELDDLIAALDPTLAVVPGGERIRRGHTNGPIRVALPAGYLDDPDDATPPDDADVMALSGG